jgi:hypothetical protein
MGVVSGSEGVLQQLVQRKGHPPRDRTAEKEWAILRILLALSQAIAA